MLFQKLSCEIEIRITNKVSRNNYTYSKYVNSKDLFFFCVISLFLVKLVFYDKFLPVNVENL